MWILKRFKNSDMIETIDDEIHISADKKTYCYKMADIVKLVILTTDQGPVFDDVALLIMVKETFFVIPSENYLFEKNSV